MRRSIIENCLLAVLATPGALFCQQMQSRILDSLVAASFYRESVILDSLLGGKRIQPTTWEKVVKEMRLVDTLPSPFADLSIYRFRWFDFGLENELIGFYGPTQSGLLDNSLAESTLVSTMALVQVASWVGTTACITDKQLLSIGELIAALASPNGYWIFGYTRKDASGQPFDTLARLDKTMPGPAISVDSSRSRLEFWCWLATKTSWGLISLEYSQHNKSLVLSFQRRGTLGEGYIRL